MVSKVAASHTSACVTANGELYIWGKGAQGSEIILPQKVVTVPNAVIDISVGASSSLVLDNEGMVWSWGSNAQGELGLGDLMYRPHPFPVMSLKHKGIT
jgi:alpha-tubulin suppressor-like RCC1 family protein